jgi:hypothetical protein
MAKSSSKGGGGGGGSSGAAAAVAATPTTTTKEKNGTDGFTTTPPMNRQKNKKDNGDDDIDVDASTTPVDEISASTMLYSWVVYGLVVYLSCIILYNAYKIRMHAINEFGPVIHEFDPYFNYRATEVRERYVTCVIT